MLHGQLSNDFLPCSDAGGCHAISVFHRFVSRMPAREILQYSNQRVVEGGRARRVQTIANNTQYRDSKVSTSQRTMMVEILILQLRKTPVQQQIRPHPNRHLQQFTHAQRYRSSGSEQPRHLQQSLFIQSMTMISHTLQTCSSRPKDCTVQ